MLQLADGSSLINSEPTHLSVSAALVDGCFATVGSMPGTRVGMVMLGLLFTLAGAGVGVGASAAFLFVFGLTLLVGAFLWNPERKASKALPKAALLTVGTIFVLASLTQGPAWVFFVGAVLFILGLDFDSNLRRRTDQGSS